MAGRSWFRHAFMGADGFHKGVPPITLAIRAWGMPVEKLRQALRQAIPRGYVGTSPQIIKTLDGEFLVGGGGSVQFVPLGRSPEEPFWL